MLGFLGGKEVKVFCFSSVKKVVFALLVLFVGAVVFAQTNEVYTETGSNVFTKEPVEDAPLTFGGLYNKSYGFLQFERFWVEGKIGVALYSNDEWNSSNFGLIADDTFLNIGFAPAWHSAFVLGTNYDKIIPGVQLYAYDDVLPGGRFGNNGLTYVFTGIAPMLGLTMALNVPFQYQMFTDDNGLETNAAIYYESDFGVNVGTRMTMDFAGDFAMGAYVSGGLERPFSWMAGYTYKGTGYDGSVPANHYIDASMAAKLGMFNLGADFEIGFEGVNDSRPLYAGVMAKVKPFSFMGAQLTALYSISDTKDYDNSFNVLTLEPKVTLEMDYCEIGLGAEITVFDSPFQDTAVGLAFPVYMKYWF